MIVSWNSGKTGYTSVEALEYRVTKWPTSQPADDPFIQFNTLEYSEPLTQYINIETADDTGAQRRVLSVLRPRGASGFCEWEHHAVWQYQINGEHVPMPTNLSEFDPLNYYRG